MRTRFAPSPTGRLHIGSARTALFNWLFARHRGGRFILRIEDTDVARSSKEFEESIYEDLRWLDLDWDEGPDKGGEKGPYRQSERLPGYKGHAEALIKKGVAYRCYCTKERIEELKQGQIKIGVPPRYDGRCRAVKEAEAPEGVSPVIRFKVPERNVSFTDGVHGPLSFDSRIFGDFVIIGSDGIAAYNFAVVADDAAMGITHIIRGDDHISNTPRQILLFEALGLTPPSYTHIPLVLAPDRTPLGKRHASASLRRLREDGFLPEALLNSIARLGWHPGDEPLSLDEMIREFSTAKLSKSPSIFDMGRLKAFNKAAIEKMDDKELLRLSSMPASAGLLEAVRAVKANAITLKDLSSLLRPFAGEPEFSEEARSILNEPYAREVLSAFRSSILEVDMLDEKVYNQTMDRVKKATKEKGHKLHMPIRCALTGETHGIELVKVLTLLGKERVIGRLSAFL